MIELTSVLCRRVKSPNRELALGGLTLGRLEALGATVPSSLTPSPDDLPSLCWEIEAGARSWPTMGLGDTLCGDMRAIDPRR